ncbi:MAG: hypothetical protein KGK08_04415 [Acidobacteriota bacterium]|nr:hypothetical protein [Acidobacteriota bacterium]
MIREQLELASQEAPPPRLQDDEHWQLVQRIVASRRFQRAPLLSRFLLHVCAETLQGRQSEISEHQIGVQVFERPRNYRTVEDNIVRNYARQLRRRLAEYANDEGQLEAYRIEIPLGGYVPVFIAQTHQDTPDEPMLAPAEATEPAALQAALSQPTEAEANQVPLRRLPGITPIWLALLLVYSLVLVAFTAGAVRHLQGARHSSQPTSILWAALFRSPLNTFIVPADSGFNLLEDLSRRQVALGNYLKQDYLALPLPAMNSLSEADLRTQRFTSFVDLQMVSAIARLPEVDPQRFFVRFPRDLRMDDLKAGNAILIGSIGSNPWAELAQRTLNFRIALDRTQQQAWVENAHPRPGESNHYQSQWNQTAHPTYAVIAYTPNLDATGHILLIEGLDVAGTQAAADALLHGDTLAPVLRAATQTSGELRPFEVLLQSTSIESSAATTQVVAYRVD